MANISKIRVNGTEYDLEDTTARAGGGIRESIKSALLNCFQHVAWIDEHGQDYYDALYDALYAKTLESITAVFTQGDAIIYNTDTLDSLKQYLVVTATYDDGTTADVTAACTLSGVLTGGTSTITANYDGKSATFTVNVTVIQLLYNWDYTQSLTDTVGGVTSELMNDAVRTSDGLVFTSNHQNVIVGRNVMAFSRTIEVDFTDVTYSAGNYTAVLWHLWNGTDDPEDGYYSTFGFRYGSSNSDRKLGCITTATSSWGYASPTVLRTAWDGTTGTLAMTVSDTGRYKFFLNGVDLNIKRNNADQYIGSAALIKAMSLGCHPNGSYVSFYNYTITGVRIYDGVKYQ